MTSSSVLKALGPGKPGPPHPRSPWDMVRRALEQRAGAVFGTPGELAQAIYPGIVQTPALDLIDERLVRLANKPNGRLILSMPPQEGKSERCARAFPLWRLTQDPNLRIAIASYEFNLARRWGRRIRDDITTNPKLGLSVKPDVASQNEWELEGKGGGVFTTGLKGAITGRPVDLLIIDDPFSGYKQADSDLERENVWEWWQANGQTRLAPGASVLLVMTRWHHDDLAGRLIDKKEDDDTFGGYPWERLNIPAQCVDPVTDPLRRTYEGEWMVSARGREKPDPETGITNWEARKAGTDLRVWEAMYQGDPIPGENQMFPESVWKERWEGMPPVDYNTEYIMSWDMAFKDTKSSDYVVGQLWCRTGANVYLIDQVRGRWSFTKTLEMFRAFCERYPFAVAKLVEDKANGTAVIDTLKNEIPGLLPVNPRGGKEPRAASISPYAVAGNIRLPAAERFPSGDKVEDLIKEAAKFPVGAHDDQVDAMSQATSYLLVPAGSLGAKLYNIG